MTCFLEACCTSVEDVLAAQAGGASRIELCEDLSCGGRTPSISLLEEVLKIAKVPINVLVRPRATADFTVSPEEADLLIEQILDCKAAGAAGIVAGALLPDGSIDTALLQRIMDAAAPLPVTFHKAFDACREPFSALEQIISVGCARILSSGCAPTALEGLPTLKELILRADGRIIIMPGGSIRPGNISRIIAETKAIEYHASAEYFR